MSLVIAVAILAVLTAAGVTVYIKVRRLSESLLGTPGLSGSPSTLLLPVSDEMIRQNGDDHANDAGHGDPDA